MDSEVECLIAAPGTKRPGFIARGLERGLRIPGAQERSYRMLVTAENLHIDILMLSRLPPQEEIDGPSARNPPGSVQLSEECRDLARMPGLPSPIRLHIINHIRSSPEAYVVAVRQEKQTKHHSLKNVALRLRAYLHSFAWTFRRGPWCAQPERDMRGLHRLLHDCHQVLAQRVEVHLTALPGAKRIQCLGGIVFVAIEAAVDNLLQAAAQRLEKRGDQQCRRDDEDGGRLTALALSERVDDGLHAHTPPTYTNARMAVSEP